MDKKSEIIKLNLGSGSDYRDGFINIDIRTDIKTDLICDVSNLDSFEDNSVDFIYASDVLEHFGWTRTNDILKEWFRILKKGGQLYIRTPDLERWAGALIFKRKPPDEVIFNIFGGQEYKENIHKSIFTKKILLEKLYAVGFEQVNIGETQQLYALNMEAQARK